METLEIHNNVSNTIKICKPQACNFIEKGTLAQELSCEFCEIFKNTFLVEHLRTTASAGICKIVETFINPIANNKIKLQDELNDAILKIVQPWSHILDTTTQKKKYNKKSNYWILGELETIKQFHYYPWYWVKRTNFLTRQS